jgi:hypothetical protein
MASNCDIPRTTGAGFIESVTFVCPLLGIDLSDLGHAAVADFPGPDLIVANMTQAPIEPALTGGRFSKNRSRGLSPTPRTPDMR